ncbi:lipase member K-like isoform X2 [Cylas formicarius]|uniref:lipase member K-like isoform X2 n=1 Tax=Cylas formicarius TaxID=197179 RepID=UPI002958899B|nr:lipase member K-like isoform X2 [Cylas formicarius]
MDQDSLDVGLIFQSIGEKARIFFCACSKYICDGFGILKRSISCDFDPDDYLDVPQIIRRHGYPSESHVIESEDGYLTKVHRIPGTKQGNTGGQPIFLQHGLLGSSIDWIVNDGNNALAFLLADQGYDVWMGNSRGNTYARGHVSLNVNTVQFWNFSWHEMGTKDLPAILYHISNITKKPGEIIYIGHSMGTTMAFVFSSVLPEMAKNLKLIVAMAPTAYMTHAQSPIKYLAPFANDVNWVLKNLGVKIFLPNSKVLRFLSYGCTKKYTKKICDTLVFALAGFDGSEFNTALLPKLLSHDPAGTSTKTPLHYAQEIQNEGNFQQFDYGLEGNMRQYGTPNPPQYDLKKIKVPMHLIYAENDKLTSYIDVERLSEVLPNVVGMVKVPSKKFSHGDFVFGKNVYELVYEPLMRVLSNYTMKN